MSESEAKWFFSQEKKSHELESDKLNILAVKQWMQDVTSLLCYQPDIPMEHKKSLVEALDRVIKL